MSLTTKQKQYLKGLAHHLKPVILVGGGGITPAVEQATDLELEAHELIKARIHRDAPINVKEGGQHLATACKAELVQTIGRMAVLYRRRSEKPSIRLPKPGSSAE